MRRAGSDNGHKNVRFLLGLSGGIDVLNCRLQILGGFTFWAGCFTSRGEIALLLSSVVVYAVFLLPCRAERRCKRVRPSTVGASWFCVAVLFFFLDLQPHKRYLWPFVGIRLGDVRSLHISSFELGGL